MYELFKKELSDLMNEVQNEIGDERTKKSGGGNDVSVYVNADFARIKEKKDNGQNVKDQELKEIKHIKITIRQVKFYWWYE